MSFPSPSFQPQHFELLGEVEDGLQQECTLAPECQENKLRSFISKLTENKHWVDYQSYSIAHADSNQTESLSAYHLANDTT